MSEIRKFIIVYHGGKEAGVIKGYDDNAAVATFTMEEARNKVKILCISHPGVTYTIAEVVDGKTITVPDYKAWVEKIKPASTGDLYAAVGAVAHGRCCEGRLPHV
jgi:hypothetical protein